MLFNSIEFIIFLPLVYLLYWFVFNKNLKAQNILLLVSSYIFYGWWDWRFLILMLISSLTDYYISIALERTDNKKIRNRLKYFSIFVNLGILGFFKYFNFFIESFGDLLQNIGLNPSFNSLQVILPVGISFYTFQTLGYTLDVYKKKFSAEKDLTSFMVYVCFFPQLVAGPIERARNLLPQINKSRTFSGIDVRDGLRLMLIGLFKKVVVADNIALSVDYIFNDFTHQNSFVLILSASMFLVQIYCDFSGYSDIAIGTAKLFGFKLMKNFDYPFYTINNQQFWTRWHISLNNWFRDYLMFNIKSTFRNRKRFAINFLLTFTIIGFWHGAGWNYIMFGFSAGVLSLPGIIWRDYFKKHSIPRNTFPNFSSFLLMIFSFYAVSIPAIFFRSLNLTQAISYFKHIYSNLNTVAFTITPNFINSLFWYLFILITEWFMRDKEHSLEISKQNKTIRWLLYLILILIIINYGEFSHKQFIYFQF